MSLFGDHICSLQMLLRKHKEYSIVIDTFITIMEDFDWSYDEIISMLKKSIGISLEIDIELNKQIDRLSKYN